MGGIGWHNPLPFEVGGGETDTEVIWRAMRSAAGQDGAGPEGGLEDQWRQIKAQAIAASAASVERAFLQSVPGKQTDHLPVWEELLGLPAEATEVERQAAVKAAITATLGAEIPTLRARLQAIDPAFDIAAAQPATATLVHFGKMFGDRLGTTPYGSGQSAGRHATGWPNFSDAFKLRVRYVLGPGQLTPPAESVAQARRYLCEALPSWVDFRITTGAGFFLDGNHGSVLDWTAFG